MKLVSVVMVPALLVAFVTAFTYARFDCIATQDKSIPDYQSPAAPDYLSGWESFLAAKSKELTSLKDFRTALPDSTLFIGFLSLSGDGRTKWIFRIDDFSEIEVITDRHLKIKQTPSLTAKHKWIRLSDGSLREVK